MRQKISMRTLSMWTCFAVLIVFAIQAVAHALPPRILQIHREVLKRGSEAAYQEIESDTARKTAELGCPHPYLAIESLTGSKEVWFFNGYESSAEQKQVAEDYAKKAALMAALQLNSTRKASLTHEPVSTFATFRSDLSRGDAWILGQDRFLVITVTKNKPPAKGTVFEAADGTRFIVTATHTRGQADAAAVISGPESRVFAVRPFWSFPAKEWIAADSEVWLRNSPSHYLVSVAAQEATATKRVKEQERPTLTLPEEQHADNDAIAKADLAIIKCREGNTETLWRTLRRNAEPAVRAYVIDRLPSSGAIQAHAVANRLRTARDAGERSALILSLGGFTEQQLPQATRNSLAGTLIGLYRNDPDAEVHAATEWLLRHTNDRPSPAAFFQEDYPFLHSSEGASQPRPDWKQKGALEAIDRQLTGKSSHQHRWSVNSEGHTMVVIRPAGPFQMGAPENEPRKEKGENLRIVCIPRNFAISNKEVSTAQFRRYLDDAGLMVKWSEALKQRFPRNTTNFTAWPENPQLGVIWYEASAYCNWLSKRDGIPHDQWVYPDEIGPGMVMPADYLHRTGYRLPTEAEWEFAARAGTTTAHFFGDGVALLDRYAWFIANSENHGWPVGMTKPNQFGLFDMYGNAWEWIQDRYLDYPTDLKETFVDNEDSVLVVTTDAKRIRRSGSFSYDKETMRSAHRGAPHGYQLDNRMDSVGFRVARTLPTRSASLPARGAN